MRIRDLVVQASGFVLAASAASAELTFCNDGASERLVAIAYAEDGDWVSEGWWKIAVSSCTVVVEGDLTRQHYYFYAPLDGEFLGEDYVFCTTPKAFTLQGADGDCAAMGAEAHDFAHIDTGSTEKSFVFSLADEVLPPEDTAPPDAASEAAPADAPASTSGAATASFEPGTHGEPFVVEATVQGCETGDAGDICFFYAEGARWAAARGQTSNEAALQVLADAPVNAPFLITGDMISFGDITAEAAVSKVEPAQPDQWAIYRDGMQGVWVSTDDPASVLRIIGSEQTLEYDGPVMEVSVMRFGNACADGVEIGPVFTTQMMGGDPMDAQCYAILDVSPDRIDLSYVGRGNTLSYTRAP